MLLVLLIPAFSYSQCSLLIESNVDKFTDEKSWSNKTPIIIKSGSGTIELFCIKLASKDAFITFHGTSVKFGCTDENSKIYFLFDDNTKYTYTSQSEFGCDNTITSYISGSIGDTALENFILNKPIKAIRISTMTGIIDFDIPKNTGADIKSIFNCFKSIL